MKIERTRNAARNIAFGAALKIYQIAVPFLIRTAMIHFMGVAYLGLDSLFVSVLEVLNLAELGVGSAMVYSMYRPIAEDDSAAICVLMKLYRTYFRIIGTVIAVIGLALTPLIPRLIKSDLPPDVNIYVLYLLNLFSTVLSYWLLACRNALFQAHQRTDVISKVSLLTKTFQYSFQLLVILVSRNYYLYVIAALFSQTLTNLITAIAASKLYPHYKPAGALNPAIVRDINSRIRDLFTARLGSVIVFSADPVVISAFLGLTVLAVYQNYSFIMTAIIGLSAAIFQACTAGIGNSLMVEAKEKNHQDLKTFTFLIAWLTGLCTCCFLCLYQPFMKIWVGDELMLPFPAVVCFCIYFYVLEFNQLLMTYKDAAGIWHKDRFRPLATALSNLVMNLIMVQFWGICGVLLSTVFSMLFIGMPWLMHNLFTTLFDRGQIRGYLKDLALYTLVALISCIACWCVCECLALSDWAALTVRAAVCFILPNLICLIAYRNKKEFAQSLLLLKRMTNRK